MSESRWLSRCVRDCDSSFPASSPFVRGGEVSPASGVRFRFPVVDVAGSV